MQALLDRVNSVGACGDLGPDAGCQFSGAVFSLDAQSVSIEQLLAHSRTLTDVGPGVFPSQETGRGGAIEFEHFVSQFSLAGDYAQVLDSLGLDPSSAEHATATGDEFSFQFGDCTGSIAIAYFPEEAIVIDLGELFCAC